jgi:glycosyltransferase involved in cell wall biosynthesis
VGRLDSEKNPLLLVDVIAQLHRRDPRWQLTIAGDGPLRSAVEDAVASRGLDDVVQLVGEVPNGSALWQLYRDSHALLHVSLTEGLPQVLLEAMAAGLPIVATDVGSVGTALGNGERGRLVRPGDAGAAAAALEELARDPMLRARIVRAGHNYVIDQTLERQAERLVAFISATTGRCASAPAAPASASSSQR